jgi:predicted Zn-dependent peptidase
MKEDDIKKEKKIILEEIRMYKDMPHYHVEDLMSEIMWKEHPLSRPLAGNYRSVRSLDCNMLSEYKKRFYHAGNMVAVIAGDINANNIDSFLKEIFANIPFKKKPQLNKFTLKQQEPQARYLNKDTQQTHLSLGFHTVKRTDKLRYALTVLSVLLGGNMSSRLFQQVREKKGLAYRISTSLRKYLDTGALVISCGLKNKKIKETINIILNELDKIKKKGITEEELSQAKEYIIGHTLLDLEATVDRMLQVGIKSITGDNETLDVKNIIKKIKKVKAEDVLQAANKFLKGKRLNLGLIGPVKKDIRSIEKRIKDF